MTDQSTTKSTERRMARYRSGQDVQFSFELDQELLFSAHVGDHDFALIVFYGGYSAGDITTAVLTELRAALGVSQEALVTYRAAGPRKQLATLRDDLIALQIEIEKKAVRNLKFDVRYDGKTNGRLQISAEDVRAIAGSIAKADPFKYRKIRVMIVDDSESICQLLEKIVISDPHMEVVAKVGLPSKVAAMIEQTKPDVITMDIYMPEMDGVALVKQIHPKYKIPIVMISSVSREEGPLVFEALENGAFDYLQKPSLRSLGEMGAVINPRLKAAAASIAPSALRHEAPVKQTQGAFDASSIIAIGSSTGGTEALKRLFMAFPDEIPPVVVAQHIPPVFSEALARRLNSYVKFTVKEAVDGEELEKNKVLIAPGGKEMSVKRVGNKLVVAVSDPIAKYRHHPSVDYMFDSVAEHIGERAVGVLLTGMGSDGALGMKSMKAKGGWNIAQDEKSCVVFGMPKSAIALGVTHVVAHLDEIADIIASKGVKKLSSA